MKTGLAPDYSTQTIYHAFGLNIASAIPFLDMETGQGVPDVIIEYGDIPETLPDATVKGVRYEAGPGVFLLNVDGIAGYHVEKGSRIVIQPDPDAAPEEILLFLMGSAMGALLHQRSILPLHAGAVLTDHGAVIFAGPSGIGKSTLVAGFQRRGYPILADDVCAVTADKTHGVSVIPGFPRIKLWADTLKKLETSRKGLRQVRQDPDFMKYFVPFESTVNRRVSVRSVFILSSAHTDAFEVEPISGMARIQPLLNHTYRPKFLEGLGNKQDHFKQCACMADTASVFRLSRPKKGFRLEELLDVAQRHWDQ